MKRNLVKIGLLASMSFSVACRAHHEKAPFGSVVSVPNDILIAWSAENNAFDFRGFIIPFDIGVFQSDNENGTSEPLPYTQVEISTSYSGVYLMPQEAVNIVSYPTLPAGVTSESDVEAACTDENGNYAMNEEWCAWYWDTQTSQFYQFTGTYADNLEEDTAGNSYFYAPTNMVTETNASGLVRAYLLIDSMPLIITNVDLETGVYEYDILDVGITANIGWDSQTFLITTSVN